MIIWLIVSNSSYAHVSRCISIHDDDNGSFYSVVKLELNIEVWYLSPSTRRFIPRPKWSDVSEYNLLDYGKMVGHLMPSMSISWEAIER